MKLHILYSFVEGPYGGGNQFLKALRSELGRQGAYASSLNSADCILVNANPTSLPYLLRQLISIKKPIIVRLDGPISLIRGKGSFIDQLLAEFISIYADGLIFQSQWSKNKNKELFKISAPEETVIYNAPDNTLFYPPRQHTPSEKIRLIATSWSDNPRKGFDIYSYLDKNLDFSRYAMTFAGNTPIEFKNITTISPVASFQLGSILREHNIYITASRNDPCSNALLEALACGLPAVALNSGGHPELIQRGGKLFNNEHDLLTVIDSVATHLQDYQKQIPTHSISVAAQTYSAFAKQVINSPVRHSSFWSKLGPSLMLYSRYYGYHLAKYFSKNE